MLNDLLEFKKIKDGDVKAFERVFRQYYTPLIRYAFSITGQKEAAEEIIQDIFYILWKDRGTLQILQSFHSYLYKSVRNRSIQYMQSLSLHEQHYENFLKQEDLAVEPSPDELLEYKELENILAQTIRKLPERRRQIFNMHRLNGIKYRDIAESLSISVKTVEAEMTKAYRTLRKEVNRYIVIRV
jgi:RNA polymerase sigma-70 factor (ECF subfamily)